MQELLNIVDWYGSLSGTFIMIFGGEKPLHVLPRYVTDKLIMQEISYHLSIGLLIVLHRKNKAPWSALPFWIRLYEIKSLKDVYAKTKDIVKFEFNTKSFNPYEPHGICKDHPERVYFPWIHEVYHWSEEDPWRYC